MPGAGRCLVQSPSAVDTRCCFNRAVRLITTQNISSLARDGPCLSSRAGEIINSIPPTLLVPQYGRELINHPPYRWLAGRAQELGF